MKLTLSTLICAAALLLACVARAAPAGDTEDFRGNWTLMSTKQPGMVHFGLSHHMHGGNSNHENDWPVAALQGLDLSAARHDVKFVIDRDAGRFDCTGFIENAEGAGFFRFTANPQFIRDMAALGFDGIDEQKQFAMAVTDVTVDFARRMKGEKLAHLDTDKLLALRIFDVTHEFIAELRAEGQPASDADKLIAFRVHGVTPEEIRQLRKAGLDTDEDHLIAYRVHGVTPEFLAKLASLGYANLDSDQLIAMRVHGVTPQYIADMKSRGMKDLSIDQLLKLRIHGID
jgi:hypothetical protein